jgi:hypothetical protein
MRVAREFSGKKVHVDFKTLALAGYFRHFLFEQL